jgi:hypothetical protein
MTSNPNNPNDGKHIVVENGQRVTVPMEKEQAEAEAKRRNALNEGSGQKVPENHRAQVKQNLCG